MTLVLVALAAGCGFRAAAPGAGAIPLEITDAAPASGESHADSAAEFAAATPAQSGPTAAPDEDSAAPSAETYEPAVETPPVSRAPTTPEPAAPEDAAPQPIPAHLLDDLISFSIDLLLLDLLLPPPIAPSAPPGGFTNLELLCRDQGIPDSVCRQRYGR